MTDEFQILSEQQHILHRPGMYAGSCTPEPYNGVINYMVDTKHVTPALLKIVSEIIDNATDEYIRTNGKYANKIDVSINSTLSGVQITVSDNGRGIPQDLIDGVPKPVVAWTQLRAGSNFDDSKRVGAGANGLGSVLTNIFSTEFIGTTSDGKNTLEVVCRNNMQEISFSSKKSKTQGTTVSFVPDLARFGLDDFTKDHEDMVLDRLRNLAITYRGIEYTFNERAIKTNSVKEIASKFDPAAVSFDYENALFVFYPLGNQEPHTLACANGIRVSQGGSHVDFVMNKVVDAIRTFIKKKHKIDVMPAAIKSNIMFASWISNFPALKFDSQSKERITNTVAEVASFFKDIDFDKIAKKLIDSPAIIDPIIQAILYKKELEEMKELAKKAKAGKKKVVINHIAATDPNPENRMLFITEGLSALNGILMSRNPLTVGGISLRGKPLNVRGMRPIEIMKNIEISDLLSVLGLEIGASAKNLNYGKIAIMTDADVDGTAIYCLLLNLFSLWPELFHENRVVRVITPLYHCVKGRHEHIFYNKADFDNFDSTGYTISYCKGLGTLSPELYAKCINTPILDNVDFPQGSMEKLEMAFGEDADKRKLWMLN